jgi:hypothetical protein
MFCSHSPTVTGETLNPRFLILSLWACNLVAMLVREVWMSIELNHNFYAKALVLIQTLVSILDGFAI